MKKIVIVLVGVMFMSCALELKNNLYYETGVWSAYNFKISFEEHKHMISINNNITPYYIYNNKVFIKTNNLFHPRYNIIEWNPEELIISNSDKKYFSLKRVNSSIRQP